LVTQLNPRVDFKIHEFDESSRKRVVIIEIDSANNIPVKFKRIAYIRVGSYKKKLSEHPEKERKIWKKGLKQDWSELICKNATIADLDKNAITKARAEFKQKKPRLADDIDDWDDLAFLNRAKLMKDVLNPTSWSQK
jgi:ATP-dependent DNA helicase RecG